jgi:quercetin dioxygenase-like cupin family protein
MKQLLTLLPVLLLTSNVADAQTRTVLSRTDLSDVPNREGILLSVAIAPGLVGAKHTHPGDEFLYLVEGTLTIEIDGKAPVTVRPGETVHIPGNAIHRAVNPNPGVPARVLTFGVFQKGQPDTTPAR